MGGGVTGRGLGGVLMGAGVVASGTSMGTGDGAGVFSAYFALFFPTDGSGVFLLDFNRRIVLVVAEMVTALKFAATASIIIAAATAFLNIIVMSIVLGACFDHFAVC